MQNHNQVDWYHPEYSHKEDNPDFKTTQVDDVHLRQPIGYVWFEKPRYRIKASGVAMRVPGER